MTFMHPALLVEDLGRVLTISQRSPLALRRLVWRVRRHPKLAEKFGLVVYRYPGSPKCERR